MKPPAVSASIASRTLLAGHVALITAGTSGIGAETARQLAMAGARAVVLNGRNEERGRALEARLCAELPETRFVYLQGDMTDPADVERVFGRTREAFGQLDALIHCGGAQVKPDLFVNAAPETFRPMIDGHYMSLVYCCHQAVPIMREGGGGAIVAIASDAGKIATPAETLIGGAKAAAIMFTRTLALEVSRYGIRANCITPSILRDTLSHARVMSNEMGRKVFEKAEAKARLGVPCPADVAPLAVFLASPLSLKITGQAVSVNGGISAA